MLEIPSRAPGGSVEGRPANALDVLSRRYTPAGELALREIAGETVIVPVCGAVAQLDSIFVLNEVGTVVWKAIAGQATGDAMVVALTEEFDVTVEEAGADVVEFLGSLLEAGLIRPCPDAEG